MKAIVVTLFFSQFLVNSCVPSNCTKSVQLSGTQLNVYSQVSELAKEKYGETFTLQENETKEFYLGTNRGKSSTETAIKFFVYEKKTHKIIHEDFINLGSVQWDGRFKIRVRKFSGIVKFKNDGEENPGYVFDVKTKQKD